MSNAPDPLSRRAGRSPARAIGLLLFVYFLTRMVSLDLLPIFLDEAVHLQWAERLYGEGRILRPVGSGRLLGVAAYSLALPFEDRLWAARLIASMVGALTLVFTILLSHRLFGARASGIAGALYILSPFALVYDRLALSDVFLAACLTGLMLAVWMLARRPRGVSPVVLCAGFIALAVASKVSALLFLLAIPLGVLALAPERRAAFRSAALASAIGLGFALPMLWFFVQNSGEISSQHVLDPIAAGSTIGATLLDMREWLLAYFTIPALIAAAVSVALLRDGRALWLVGSVVLPFLLFALLSQPWSARYVLPTLPPFLVLISGGIEFLVSRFKPPLGGVAALGLTLLASLAGLSFDRDLLLAPERAPFPGDDRRQLVTGWPSGYGVRDLALRLKREALEGGLTVYVDTGGTRTLQTSLSVLLGRHPSIRLVEGDLGEESFRASMIQQMRKGRAFAVLGPRPSDRGFRLLVPGAVVERVELYQRPGGEWAATLFRLLDPGETTPAAGAEGRLF